MIIDMVHTVTLLAVAINHVKLKSSVLNTVFGTVLNIKDNLGLDLPKIGTRSHHRGIDWSMLVFSEESKEFLFLLL